MINYDTDAGTFIITDLGRIAAKYYIRYKSMEIFNEEFKAKMGEADVLHMLCRSTEVSCSFSVLSRVRTISTGYCSLTKFKYGRTKSMS